MTILSSKNAKKAITEFFKRNYGYFLIPVFVYAVFAFAQAYFDIYPYGKAIMASYDQLAQVCPFLEHYFAVADGTSGLFHTFFVGGGMDVFGILSFCTISPFSFLFLIGGRGNSVYMVSFVLPLKVICSGLSAQWFVKKHFKEIPSYIGAVMSLLYAFAGYLYVSNTYINWTDLMIYMPLVGSGFIRFAKEDKIGLLSFSLAAMIYTCFSISCFSFFLLFPSLVLYVPFCVEKEKRKTKLTKLCMSFVIAVTAALPLLFPAFMAYKSAGRNTGIFSRIFSSGVNDATPLYEKFTYIAADGVFLFLAVVYFFRSGKKDRTSYFLYACLAIYLFPCVIDESMLLLNAGSYNSYALRFGFLGDFLLFYLALKGISEYLAKDETIPDMPLKKSGAFMALTAAAVFGGAFGTYRLFQYILGGKTSDGQVFQKGKAFYSFFPAFAHSEGGLEGTAILLGITVIVFALAAVFLGLKFVKMKDVAILLCIFSLTQVSFFGFALVKGDRQGGSAENYDKYESLLTQIDEKETEDPYYRLKSYDYYISSDSPLILRYNAYTFFSSMADSKNLTPPVFFSYGGNDTNSTKSNRGNLFSDCLLGYKYVVYKTSSVSAANNRSYLKKTGITEDDYVVYENTLCFPSAFKVSGGDMSFEGLNYIRSVEKIYSCLSGGESPFTEVPLTVTKEDDGFYTVLATGVARSDFYFAAEFPDLPRYVTTNGQGKEVALADHYSYNYRAYLPSETIRIKDTKGELTEEDIVKYCHAFSIEQSKIASLQAKAKENRVNYTLRKNGIDTEPFLAEEGQYLFMNYADLDGYTVTVNGKKVEFAECGLDMMLIPLEEGENVVKIEYKSPYIRYILVGLAAAGLLSAAWFFILKKKPEILVKVSPVISVAAYSLTILLAIAFAAFPFGVYLYKLILSFL